MVSYYLNVSVYLMVQMIVCFLESATSAIFFLFEFVSLQHRICKRAT